MRFDPTSRWFGDYGLHLWFIAFLLAYSLLCCRCWARCGARAARGCCAGCPRPTPVLLLLFVPILASQWCCESRPLAP